jgi:hypothetical protein
MRVQNFFTMEINGAQEPERSLMQQGTTWPALMALNSSFKLETKNFRKRLLTTLKGLCNEKGMMPFFINADLQKKYQPDLECTALFVAACLLNGEKIVTDLDDIKKRVLPNGFFQTWIGRAEQPIDYISQLIMCICYGTAGLDIEQALAQTITTKFRDFPALNSRDVYYTNPLYFIYFTLYLKDKGLLPNNYQRLIERFIKTYIPADEVEVNMLRKICSKFKLPYIPHTISSRRTPFFTNGTRHYVEYYSDSVKEVFRTSVDFDRKHRFNRSLATNSVPTAV